VVFVFGIIPMSWSSVIQSALRIAAGLSFMTHGTQKLFAWPVTQAREPVELLTQSGLAGVLETFGGALMIVGLLTRPVAFILAGQMAWAYFQAHAPRSVWPVLNGGEPAMLFSFIWLFFAAAGPGPVSLDAMLWRRRPARRRV
jgi:putative oxidoreductase